jgi:glycerate kinase
VACPDKFRGTLSAAAASAAIATGLRRAGYDEVTEIPMADGGEGSLEAIRDACGGAFRTTRVTGPLGAPVDAEWLVLPDGTAVIEMARASGRALVTGRSDPLGATTRGTGELLAAARAGGTRRAVVCVGGSATTDGGLGAVEALGWSLRGLEVTVACDVTTTFVDAAAVFGPQKGASPAQVDLLARRLAALLDDYRQRTGVDLADLEGAGAAGGLAGGLAALGARLEPGYEVIARLAGLDRALEDAHLVVTGEGRVDATSFAGKVVGGVLEWSIDEGVPHRAVIAGQVTDEARDELAVLPSTEVLPLTDRVWTPAETFVRPALLVEEAAVEAGRHALADAPG